MASLRRLLWPASLLYECGVASRNLAFLSRIRKRRQLAGRVISVGNLTVGGTGKTPMVMWLAERLLAEGKSVGILTRGYGGNTDRKLRWAKESDEVALLRARLPESVMFGVGADRFAKGRELERAGVEWFLLDDGFQHRQLARDVDIVLLDAMDPFGGGLLLPAGKLREPRSALRRASIIMITRTERAPAIEAVVRRYTNAPIFYAWTRLRGVFDSASADPRNPALVDFRSRHLYAFCTIGNPSAFFDDLKRWGFSVAGETIFRDHHRLTQKDTVELNRRARAVKADGFICTEKDLWNDARLCASQLPVWVCRMDLQIPDGERFWQTVGEQSEHRAARGRE